MIVLIGLALWLLVIPACLFLTLYAAHRRGERRHAGPPAEVIQLRPKGSR